MGGGSWPDTLFVGRFQVRAGARSRLAARGGGVVVGRVARGGRPWSTGPPTAAVSAGELELGSDCLSPRVWGF